MSLVQGLRADEPVTEAAASSVVEEGQSQATQLHASAAKEVKELGEQLKDAGVEIARLKQEVSFCTHQALAKSFCTQPQTLSESCPCFACIPSLTLCTSNICKLVAREVEARQMQEEADDAAVAASRRIAHLERSIRTAKEDQQVRDKQRDFGVDPAHTRPSEGKKCASGSP